MQICAHIGGAAPFRKDSLDVCRRGDPGCATEQFCSLQLFLHAAGADDACSCGMLSDLQVCRVAVHMWVTHITVMGGSGLAVL